jgi:hypothetical protein
VDGVLGLWRGCWLRTEMNGDVLLMPYTPRGTKQIGNR